MAKENTAIIDEAGVGTRIVTHIIYEASDGPNGGPAIEEYQITTDVAYDPTVTDGSSKIIFFQQDEAGGHLVDLSDIHFTPSQVDLIDDAPNALSSIYIVKRALQWYAVSGVERGYNA